ncbi:uncharacterized protein N7473_003845 [Penicillium subrubescens]|uniref:Uncharacterized protein n=1 Tax=Penicillium subrubescens TaxID=1316194 RepID=A0A1Q5U9Q5_9EURO|nr:uncharacterized protein N7473_003845 [Penicillium subrubescens]KAJ5906929.1 hypothetical protein N7473_003845 [Penicillium subrubescens]OKP09206.1 hypothetical protein PENSUB_5414 [Penicillium subrubescens]
MIGVIQTPLDNKTTPIKVPGLGDIPVHVLLSHDQFATGTNEWKGHILTAKELAMLDLINTITDRPNWNRAIFDQQIIAQWQEDAMSSSSLINDKTWAWCLQELQDKARHFDQDGRLVVFNTSSGVSKSDTAISPELGSKLSNSVDLLSHQAILEKSDSAVVNLVDSSLFPLVYGRTKILVGGGSCRLDEKGWPSCSTEDLVVSEVPQLVTERSDWSLYGGQYIWSSKFQWLPCEVQFTGPSGSSDVQISSYINNLHPGNRECYAAIEAVISSSIKQWNEIMVRNKWRRAIGSFHGNCVYCPREPIRIRTFGVEWKAQFPEWAKKLPEKEDENKLSAEEYGVMCSQVEAYLEEPESQDAVCWPWVRTQRIPEDWKSRWGLLRTALTKYANTFVFQHSDPGTAYSYEDWKAGRTGKAIVGPAHHDHVCSAIHELSQFMGSNPWLQPYEWMYRPKGEDADDHRFYTLALQEEFREQGLQVVVRIHSIELDPGTPFYPGEEWHTEGNANERIVANAIYTLDSTNMSEPQIGFRQRCSLGGETWVYDRFGAMDSDNDESDRDSNDSYRDLLLEHALWDLEYISRLFGYEDIQYSPAWQQLGEVKLRPGRLISFPNAFQHRMGPLKLQDETKPGRCRFLTLSLIDPTYRLCSTWNVPPQQPGLNHSSDSESAKQMDLTEALKLRDELLKEHIKKDEGIFKLAQTMSFSGFS